jgi:hypothetical protein
MQETGCVGAKGARSTSRAETGYATAEEIRLPHAQRNRPHDEGLSIPGRLDCPLRAYVV